MKILGLVLACLTLVWAKGAKYGRRQTYKTEMKVDVLKLRCDQSLFDACTERGCSVELVKTMRRKLSDDEITKMVACRNEVYPKRRSTTHLKIELIQRRDRAIEVKDRKTAIECQRMIEEIEDNEENKDHSFVKQSVCFIQQITAVLSRTLSLRKMF